MTESKQLMKDESLLHKTMHELKTAKETITRVSAETGLNKHWLYKLKEGHIKDPSVNKIQKLYEYLTGGCYGG